MSILMDLYSPSRIVCRYYGFKDEYSLREKLFSWLVKNNPIEHPHNLPDLIILNDMSLLKLNNLTYSAKLVNGYWPFYASEGKNAFINFLKVIYCRILLRKGLSSELIGDHSSKEVNPYLFAKGQFNLQSDRIQWQIDRYFMDREQLAKNRSE